MLVAAADPGRVGHVMRLYVRPRSQGSGLGRRLLEAACDALAGRGHVEATLWTPEPTWNRAHGFYRRLGWNLEEVRNGDDPPDIRYRRADLLNARSLGRSRRPDCDGDVPHVRVGAATRPR